MDCLWLHDEGIEITLSKILNIPVNDSPSGRILKRKRLDVAITLASSVLQLDGTSRLGPRWSTRDTYSTAPPAHLLRFCFWENFDASKEWG